MKPAVTTNPAPDPPPPNVHIQWKGTDACLDLHCRCGTSSHYDGYFAYALRCPGCHRIYTLPNTVTITEGGDESAAQDAIDDWGQQ